MLKQSCKNMVLENLVQNNDKNLTSDVYSNIFSNRKYKKYKLRQNLSKNIKLTKQLKNNI